MMTDNDDDDHNDDYDDGSQDSLLSVHDSDDDVAANSFIYMKHRHMNKTEYNSST